MVRQADTNTIPNLGFRRTVVTFLGHVALGAQLPIVVKLSRERSVGRSVGRLSSALWKNCGSDPNAVWHHRSDGPGMRQVVGFGDRSTGRGTFGGEFVTNGDFTAYESDSAATLPSSQITLGRIFAK